MRVSTPGGTKGVLSRGKNKPNRQKYFEEASWGMRGKKMRLGDWDGEHGLPEPAQQRLRTPSAPRVPAPYPLSPPSSPLQCTLRAGQGNAGV